MYMDLQYSDIQGAISMSTCTYSCLPAFAQHAHMHARKPGQGVYA